MHEYAKKRVLSKMKNKMKNKKNEMTNLDIIKYWMDLIFTYAIPEEQNTNQAVRKPQIAVVGTHYDSIPGTDNDKDNRTEEQFELIWRAIKGTPYEAHVIKKPYAIDNKTRIVKVLNELKQDLSGYLNTLTQVIPLKWLELQRQLQELGKTAVRTTYDEVCKIATSCGISAQNLIHTLHYLHDIGVILYFENNNLLKHSVITNPRKLIGVFKSIVTWLKDDDKEKYPAMVKLWDKLDDEGILEEELARHVWRKELREDKENFEVFVEIMKEFGLLCERIQKDKTDLQLSFFVPCRLGHNEETMKIEQDPIQQVSLYVVSTDFIPKTIFHPLVVRFIVMIQDMGYKATPVLYRNKACIALGLYHNLILGYVDIKNRPSIKLEISCMSEYGQQVTTDEPSPRVCMQILEFLMAELKALTSTMKHTGYEFHVLCWRTDLPLHFHNLEDCLSDDAIECKSLRLRTTKLRRFFRNEDSPKEVKASSSMNKESTQSDVDYIDDNHLCRITEGMGIEWKQLGVRLGLSWTEIKKISYDNKLSSNDCTMSMLVKWRNQQNYETNQMALMCSALKYQGLTELAHKLYGNVFKEEKQTVNREKEGYLTDLDMLFIGTRLDEDWEMCAIYLGIKRSLIKQIKMDFAPPIVDAIVEMLVKWRECQKADVNLLQMMCKALVQLEREDIKEELINYYQ